MTAVLPEHCRSLFVGDLSCFCQEQDVQNAFCTFGEIETIRVMRGKGNKSLGYGFVTYSTVESARAAVKALDGSILLGRTMKVSWANERSPIKQQYHPSTSSPQRSPNTFLTKTAQVHFSFISKQQVFLVTEETVREVFERFARVSSDSVLGLGLGPDESTTQLVEDISIKKSSVDPQTGEQNGYGFVHFSLTNEGINGAIRATRALQQIFVNRVLYDCCLTWSLEAIIRERQQLQLQAEQSPQQQPRQRLQFDQFRGLGLPTAYPQTGSGGSFYSQNSFQSFPERPSSASSSGSNSVNEQVALSSMPPSPPLFHLRSPSYKSDAFNVHNLHSNSLFLSGGLPFPAQPVQRQQQLPASFLPGFSFFD